MNDVWDWDEWAKPDDLLSPYVGSAYPPGLLETYFAQKMALHRAMATEIARMLATGTDDLETLDRPSRPIGTVPAAPKT